MNLLQRIYHLYANASVNVEYEGQQASDLIRSELISNEPKMIARIGSTELQAIAYVINSRSDIRRPIERLKRKSILKKMSVLSGFFPSTEENIIRFTELMLEDIKQMDVIGSWRKEEKLLTEELKGAKKIRLQDIEPYYHESPWSEVLAGKTVLVIHPFTKSIEKQYKQREFLFENKDVLPHFNLKTIKAVQSIASNKPEYDSWFEALDYMKAKIDQVDFDIALIGCGAYGFPLAAHVKRKGKKAVLVGGALQILFGIKGKRWESHPIISKFINEHWIKPLDEERPRNSTSVDGGSYW